MPGATFHIPSSIGQVRDVVMQLCDGVRQQDDPNLVSQIDPTYLPSDGKRIMPTLDLRCGRMGFPKKIDGIWMVKLYEDDDGTTWLRLGCMPFAGFLADMFLLNGKKGLEIFYQDLPAVFSNRGIGGVSRTAAPEYLV